MTLIKYRSVAEPGDGPAPSREPNPLTAFAERLAPLGITLHRRTPTGWRPLRSGTETRSPEDVGDDRRTVRGDLAAVWTAPIDGTARCLLDELLIGIESVEEADRTREASDLDARESEALRTVAASILAVRDLGQVLLTIVNRTLGLLEADICGVLLRDGEHIEMRACVGHRMIETAQLRMRRGQGVAGQVFETGEITRVDSYVTDGTISSDFVSLAGQEATRSALAVPLVLHGEMVGVLEVWRRRDSTFTDADVRRMVTLADLATICIENARLGEAEHRMLTELRSTHAEVERQVDALRRSADLQNALLESILRTGASPGRVLRTVAERLECDAVFVAVDGGVETTAASDDAVGRVAAWVRAHLPTITSHGGPLRRQLDDGTRFWTCQVVAGDHEFGAVALIDSRSSIDEAMAAAAGHVAMSCALVFLEQRAASRARHAAFEQIVWDLVDGPPEHRRAAIARAHEMGLSLGAPHRILHAGLGELDEHGRERGWDTASVDRVRRTLVRALRSQSKAGRPIELVSVRGDWVVAVASVEGRSDAKALAADLAAAAAEAADGVQLRWGVSAPRSDPMEYPDAFAEAETALTAARRLRNGHISLYDELGFVRLLLGQSASSPDLQAFVGDVTDPLREYDRRHDGALVTTLHAYFECDCSQVRSASALFVHPKTLRYRLSQIEELTGLDLSSHSDRVRADLALRLLEVGEAPA